MVLQGLEGDPEGNSGSTVASGTEPSNSNLTNPTTHIIPIMPIVPINDMADNLLRTDGTENMLSMLPTSPTGHIAGHIASLVESIDGSDRAITLSRPNMCAVDSGT